jgi:hypothetical protein
MEWVKVYLNCVVDPTLVFRISNNFKLVIIQQIYTFEVENQSRILQPKDNHQKFIGVLKNNMGMCKVNIMWEGV